MSNFSSRKRLQQFGTCAVIVIRQAHWPTDEAAVRSIRHEVFVQEQGVPEALEWDGLDPRCAHVLALGSDRTPVGTGRLLPEGKIGRLAVRKLWRGQGIGSALLGALIQLGKAQGHPNLYLHAQLKARIFYENHGFQSVRSSFIEAGIPHQKMAYRLTAPSCRTRAL
ncbi:MAG: GNAT family N-acetyltransferase [Gammaproteobacteria bacterium]